MSEANTGTAANRPIRIDDLAEMGEIQPATGWVVHQIVGTRSGLATLWAWCKVHENAAGYTEVIYTRADGVTLADPGHNPELGPVLFKVFC